MAISRDKKQSLVGELTDLLSAAKMTVFAKYEGLSVADLQTLRRAAREQGVTIKVVKNRLVRVAMQHTDALKSTETGAMTGQLLYAISSEDEVAPARCSQPLPKPTRHSSLLARSRAKAKRSTRQRCKHSLPSQARTSSLRKFWQPFRLRSTVYSVAFLATCTPCLTESKQKQPINPYKRNQLQWLI